MIDFGQFEALAHGWRMYMHGKRRSGRTTELVRALQDGDLVLVTDHVHGSRLERLAREAGKDVKAYVHPTNRPLGENLSHLLTQVKPNTRIMADHTWIECYIADRLHGMAAEFDWFVDQVDARAKAEREERVHYTGFFA